MMAVIRTSMSQRRAHFIQGLLFVALVASVRGAVPIAPEPLPELRIPGFRFPEAEATLTNWITAMTRERAGMSAAAANIQLHGWGLWAAVTSATEQIYEGQPLRVFETWQTPQELAALSVAPATASAATSRPRGPLRTMRSLRVDAATDGEPALAEELNPIDRVMGFVKFDPTSAAHITSQRLLSRVALDTLLEGGAAQVPPFPATTLVVKPVFQVIAAKDLVEGRYYALKVWSGPPTTPQAAPPISWPGCVWIDLLDGSGGSGTIDFVGATDGSSRTDATTYPLASLLHFRLSASDARALNQSKPDTDAATGDQAILVAMHLTSRETARWTWHTFWWTPDADAPPAPSSLAIARARPLQLRGPARHYAMALAYTMLTPDQPYVGGENIGAPVYAYNPWIEAKLSPAELLDSLPGTDPHGAATGNNFGIQSNCMSCHARANYNPHLRATAPRPAGARYSDLIDPQFVGTLQVDFLWSLARHAQ
jgi:hypothetical protein